MVLHEPQRVRAVQMLAAGDEPDLVVGERLHRFSWSAAGRGSDPLLLGRLLGGRRRDGTGGQHHKRATLECMHSSAFASRSCTRRVPTVAAHWVVFRKRRGGADRSTVGPARTAAGPKQTNAVSGAGRRGRVTRLARIGKYKPWSY